MRVAPAVPDRPGAPLGHYWKELPATGKDLEASTGARSSAFLRVAGLRLEESGGSRVRGWIDLGEDHHTPWGVVHGGVYTAAVESAASLEAFTPQHRVRLRSSRTLSPALQVQKSIRRASESRPSTRSLADLD
jgi:hypothetical protein